MTARKKIFRPGASVIQRMSIVGLVSACVVLSGTVSGQSLVELDDPNSEDGAPDDPGNFYAPSPSGEVELTLGTFGSSTEEKGQAPSDVRELTDNDLEFVRGGEIFVAPTSQANPIYFSDEKFGDLTVLQSQVASEGLTRAVITLRPARNSSGDPRLAALANVGEVEQIVTVNDGIVVQTFEHLPLIVADLGAKAIGALLNSEFVAGIESEQELELFHESTTPIIGSDVLNLHSTDGSGYTGGPGAWSVAVMDNGFRTSHDAFSGRVVQESCFATDSSCPNGTNSQVDGNAASGGCGSLSLCDHGTHVAGSALGNFRSTGLLTKDGVSPGASLMAIDVFNSNNLASSTAILNAFNHVANEVINNGRQVASVNLSLGGGLFFGSCDTALPAMTIAAQTLRDNDVLVVAAAGNNGSTNSISWPACISSIMSVGAVTDGDQVASFSNASTALDIWAPGVNVDSADESSDTAIAFGYQGTSMASPHVAGAVAMARECIDPSIFASAPADVIFSQLTAAPQVTDQRVAGGVTRPRLDVLDTLPSGLSQSLFSDRLLLNTNNGSSLWFTMCAITEAGEPAHSNGSPTTASTWFEFQVPQTGVYGFDTCDSATTFDTVLSAYTGSSLNNLSRIASNDDSCGLRSEIVIQAQAGDTVYIAVSGFGFPNGFGSTGIFLLNWDMRSSNIFTCNGQIGTMLGSANGDTIIGTNQDDVIISGGGNDFVRAGAGNDVVCLGGGNDSAFGDTGDDFILGGTDDDSIEGGAGNDSIRGNAGSDELRGDAGDDYLFGDSGEDLLVGHDGNDFLSAHGGVDTLFGSAGNDRVFGGPGNDTLNGGDGNDSLGGHGGNDLILGGDGADYLAGHTGDDRMLGENGVDRLFGGPDDDELFGGDGNDLLNGNTGDDTLYGEGQDDTMSGSFGIDLCNGGSNTPSGSDVAFASCETVQAVP